MNNTARFRFYEELNDFLPPARRKTEFIYTFNGNPSIKDAVEALGVPHTEADMILVNGASVDFSYHLKNNDAVSVYPVFEALDVAGATRLRVQPLREPKFICDVHLGKLARKLRMLGFDALYRNDYSDARIIEISLTEKRCVLTRDRGILKNNRVTHGYCVRSPEAFAQLAEVLARFDLFSLIRPFVRCMECNRPVGRIDKASIIDKLQPDTIRYFGEFFQCEGCGKVYWKGSHYEKMLKFMESIRKPDIKAGDTSTGA
jgi:uncharacterized protein with PIN domain